MNNSLVSLIGTGPGDPELITLKALKVIHNSDVLLYDRLVNPCLIDLATRAKEKIYVGKTPFVKQWQQKDINDLLIAKARQYGRVARLKGGDPFIFGRGFEELEALRRQNIPVEVVPGISSSTGVPALCNIPLTLRGVSESVWIVTATTRFGALSRGIGLALQSSATIVVLMGMHHIEQIARLLSAEGKAGLPVAVIQNGSLPDEKVAVDTAANICKTVKQQNMSNPAVIVIGEVVRHAHPARFPETCELICKSSIIDTCVH